MAYMISGPMFSKGSIERTTHFPSSGARPAELPRTHEQNPFPPTNPLKPLTETSVPNNIYLSIYIDVYIHIYIYTYIYIYMYVCSPVWGVYDQGLGGVHYQ